MPEAEEEEAAAENRHVFDTVANEVRPARALPTKIGHSVRGTAHAAANSTCAPVLSCIMYDSRLISSSKAAAIRG